MVEDDDDINGVVDNSYGVVNCTSGVNPHGRRFLLSVRGMAAMAEALLFSLLLAVAFVVVFSVVIIVAFGGCWSLFRHGNDDDFAGELVEHIVAQDG